MSTTIIAGRTTITGDLKDYDFGETNTIFRFYINRAADPSGVISIEMPTPNPTIIQAVKTTGLRTLNNNATVDFNNNRIKLIGAVTNPGFVRDNKDKNRAGSSSMIG